MEALKNTAEDLFDHAGNLVDTYYKLTVIKATDKATTVASSGMIVLVSLVIGLLVLFFGGIGLAWWIGETMQNMKAGFFIVGGGFLLLLLIVGLTRKRIMFPFLRNMLIRKLYE